MSQKWPIWKPVQGPHSRLIFRLARWPSNWLLGGPRTVTQKGSILQKETSKYVLWALNWLSGKVSSGPAGGCPACINICTSQYMYIYMDITREQNEQRKRERYRESRYRERECVCVWHRYRYIERAKEYTKAQPLVWRWPSPCLLLLRGLNKVKPAFIVMELNIGFHVTSALGCLAVHQALSWMSKAQQRLAELDDPIVEGLSVDS